ncbi:MAG: hypothetical protein KAV00_04045 [Phycisphaerae bacterium]|nr:hypothetical protein [Phycisphaerae bacterium]
MIQLTCSQCGSNLRVTDKMAGKKGKCPKCGKMNVIPCPDDKPPPEEQQDGSSLRDLAAAASKASSPTPLPNVAPAAHQPASTPVHGQSSRSRRQSSENPPNYTGVKFIGYLFIGLGVLLWIAGMVILIKSLTTPSESGMHDITTTSPGQTVVRTVWTGPSGDQVMSGVIMAILCGILGFIFIGVGQLFSCIRDMAQNSYYLRRL